MSRSPVFVPDSHHLTLEIIYEALFCHRNFSPPENQEPYQEIGDFRYRKQRTNLALRYSLLFFGFSEKKYFLLLVMVLDFERGLPAVLKVSY